MPDLKTPPSASDLTMREVVEQPIKPQYANGNGTSAHHGAVRSTVDESETEHVEKRDIYQHAHTGTIPTPADSTVAEPEIRPQSIRMQLRFWRILIFAGWLFVRILFWQVYAKKYIPGYVSRTEVKRWRKYAREFRYFAIALGGLFIKLGQFISTRVDIFPDEVTQELASLQDEVPTIAFDKIRAIVIDELGSIDKRYSEFDEKPIARRVARTGASRPFAEWRKSRRQGAATQHPHHLLH